MSRLTERQQLARAMAESSAMTPALATTRDAKGDARRGTRDATSDGTPRTPAPRATTTTRATMDSSSTSTTRGKRRSRVEKELASLAPWAWDPLVGRHAPGPSALRDFSEVVADGVAARVANAIGSGQKIEMKTFDRTLALRGDDAREGEGGGERANEAAGEDDAGEGDETSERDDGDENDGDEKSRTFFQGGGGDADRFVQDFGRRRGDADGEETDADEREDDARIELRADDGDRGRRRR